MSIYHPLLLYDCFKFTFYGLKEIQDGFLFVGVLLFFYSFIPKFY